MIRIAKKVKYLEIVAQMSKHGFSQIQVAKKINIRPPSFSKKLSGDTQWKKSEIDALCKLFGKTYEELFKRED